MSGWLLSIGRNLQGNWPLGRDAGVWATRTQQSIRAGDDLFFWMASDGLIAHARALSDASAADDDTYQNLPWPNKFDSNDSRVYRSVFSMAVIEERQAFSERWTPLSGRLQIGGDLRSPRKLSNAATTSLNLMFRPDVSSSGATIHYEPELRKARIPNIPATDPRTDIPITVTSPPTAPDPDAIGAALNRHNITVAWLFAQIRAQGLNPILPPPFMHGEPDGLWEVGARFHVAEVKGLTDLNQLDQLRKGLGQVLHYRFLLRRADHEVSAWLVTNIEPIDPNWEQICAQENVRLWWPGRGAAPVTKS